MVVHANTSQFVTALVTMSFYDAGITEANCQEIYKGGQMHFTSYIPGMEENSFTGFVAGEGYQINALQDIDLTGIVTIDAVESSRRCGGFSIVVQATGGEVNNGETNFTIAGIQGANLYRSGILQLPIIDEENTYAVQHPITYVWTVGPALSTGEVLFFAPYQ